MDDDRGVRDVMVEMLMHLGYHVRFAGDGLEAIEQYQEAASAGVPFDVVIADLTIPDGMGGKELIKELQKHRPGGQGSHFKRLFQRFGASRLQGTRLSGMRGKTL